MLDSRERIWTHEAVLGILRDGFYYNSQPSGGFIGVMKDY